MARCELHAAVGEVGCRSSHSAFWLVILTTLFPMGGLAFQQSWGAQPPGRGLDVSIFVPTAAHAGVCVVASVAAFCAIWHTRADNVLNRKRPPGLGLASLAAGFLVGVAALYSLLLLVFTPLFFFAILMMGAGLLAFAPYVALWGGISFERYMALVHRVVGSPPGTHRRWSLGGIALGVAALLAIDGRPIALEEALRRFEKDPASAAAATTAVRLVAGREQLRERCFRPNSGSLVAHLLAVGAHLPPVQPHVPRWAYWRAYGEAFNARPAPFPAPGTRGWDEEFWFDARLPMPPAVPRRILGSVLRARIDAARRIATAQWAFRLDSPSRHQDARMRLRLPPGAVVTGASETSAGAVVQAVIGPRELGPPLDPRLPVGGDLVVTTVGEDLVQLEVCGLEDRATEVTLSFTAPLVELDTPVLQPPEVVQANFAVERPLPDEMELELTGDGQLECAGGVAERPRQLRVVTSKFENMRDVERLLVTVRPAAPASASPAVPPPALFLVVDGTAALGTFPWEQLLVRQPCDVAVRATSTGDPGAAWDGRCGDPGLGAWLAARRFAGGPDPVPALLDALERAKAKPGARVVWLHGPQPVQLSSAAELARRLRVDGAPALSTLAARPGMNALIDELERRGAPCRTVPRVLDVSSDLARALRRASFARAAATAPALDPERQLWAAARTRELAAAGATAEAVKLARAHGVVTPLTTALVPFRAGEYGAEPYAVGPAPGGQMPVGNVPEPETLLLVALGFAVLVVADRRALRARRD